MEQIININILNFHACNPTHPSDTSLAHSCQMYHLIQVSDFTETEIILIFSFTTAFICLNL